MVADSLEIGAALHQDVDILVITVRFHIFGQIYQIGVHLVCKLVQIVLVFVNHINSARVKPHQQNTASLQILQRYFAHMTDGFIGFAEGHGRHFVQLGIRHSKVSSVFRILRLRLHDGQRQFHKCTRKRNQCHCSQQIEQGLEVCNSAAVYHTAPEVRETTHRLNQRHDDHECNGTDYIEGNMHDTGSFRIF